MPHGKLGILSLLFVCAYVSDISPTKLRKRIEHNLIVHVGKSEAEVTNTKRLCSRYCTAEANYRQT